MQSRARRSERIKTKSKAAADAKSKRAFGPGLSLLGAVALRVTGAVNVGSAQAFNKCKACQLGENAENRTGPILNGVADAQAGAVEGFRFSAAMIESGAARAAKALTAFLTKPKHFMPKIRMAFAGLGKAGDIANVTGCLGTLAADGSPSQQARAATLQRQVL